MLLDDRGAAVLAVRVGPAGDCTRYASDNGSDRGANAWHHAADHGAADRADGRAADLFAVVVITARLNDVFSYHSLLGHDFDLSIVDAGSCAVAPKTGGSCLAPERSADACGHISGRPIRRATPTDGDAPMHRLDALRDRAPRGTRQYPAFSRCLAAVLLEVHDEWAIAERRYLAEGSMALVDRVTDDGSTKEVDGAKSLLLAS